DEAVLAELMRQATGEAACSRRSIAGADNGDRLAVEQLEVALGHQQRRCVLLLGEEARIEPLPNRQIARAELLHFGNLALGIVAAEEPRRTPAAAPSEVGHCRERRR